MADVPKDLLQEIEKLTEMFTVPAEKLKSITTHFISELEKGEKFIHKLPSLPLNEFRSERRGWQHCSLLLCNYLYVTCLTVAAYESDMVHGFPDRI